MSGDDGLQEAIAVAIYASDHGDPDYWDEARDTLKGEYRANAAAVLALPELEAWAERRARERAAAELHMAAVAFWEMASPTLTNDPFIRASDWAARILDTRLSERYPDAPAADDGTGRP